MGRNAEAQASDAVITVRGDNWEVVSSFECNGSMFTSNSTLDAGVTTDLPALELRSKGCKRPRFGPPEPITTKLPFLQSTVMSMLYGGET